MSRLIIGMLLLFAITACEPIVEREAGTDRPAPSTTRVAAQALGSIQAFAEDLFDRPLLGGNWFSLLPGFGITEKETVHIGPWAWEGWLHVSDPAPSVAPCLQWTHPMKSEDHAAELTVVRGSDVAVMVRMEALGQASTLPDLRGYSFRYRSAWGGWILMRHADSGESVADFLSEAEAVALPKIGPETAKGKNVPVVDLSERIVPYRLRLVADGNTIVGYVNGIKKVSFTETTPVSGGTGHTYKHVGIISWASGVSADNFRAVDALDDDAH